MFISQQITFVFKMPEELEAEQRFLKMNPDVERLHPTTLGNAYRISSNFNCNADRFEFKGDNV